MQLITNGDISVEVKRLNRVEALWQQGFRPKRILEVLLRESMFSDSQLAEASTSEGAAKLLALVRFEFREVERKKITQRRLDVLSGLTSGMTEIEISRELTAKKLLPSQNAKSAYELTRKECLRVIREMKAVDAMKKQGAKSLFIRQATRIMKESLALAEKAASDGDFRGAAVLYNSALKAAEDAALVQGVDVDGRDREDQQGFDVSREAAQAIIEAHRQRRAKLQEAETPPGEQTITLRDSSHLDVVTTTSG